MTPKQKDETSETEETTEETETTETEEADDDEDNWNRLGTLIDERLEAWQAKQPKKTTSSHSQKKPVPQKRKQGFLTRGFFSDPMGGGE